MAEDPIWGRKPNLKVVAGNDTTKAQDDEASADGLLLDERGDWDEEGLFKRSWLAPGYLMEGSVTIMAGSPAAGKSLIAVGLAAACALGQAWGRFKPVEQMRVSLLNIEDDDLEQKKRLSAVLRQFAGAGPKELVGWLARVQPKRSPILLRWAADEDLAFHLVTTPLMAELTRHVVEFKPKVLFVDPMAEVHNAEENRNEVMKAIVAFFRGFAKQHRLAVVLIHHVTKGSGDRAGEQDIIRGGGSLSAAARVALTCMPMTIGDAERVGVPAGARFSFVRVDGAKLNYGPVGHCDWYVKDVIQLANGEDTPAAAPWAPPVPKEISLDLLADLVAAIGRGIDGEPYSPKLGTDSRSVRNLFRSREIERSREKKVLDQLAAMGVETHKFFATNRHPMKGLRTNERLPAARWADAPPPGDEAESEVETEGDICADGALVDPENALTQPEIALPENDVSFDWSFGDAS